MSTRGLLGWAAAAGAGVTALEYRRRARAAAREAEVLLDAGEGLRDMAVLVAQHAEPRDLFASVAEEVSRLAFADEVHMVRYHDDGTAVGLGGWSEGVPLIAEGTRMAIGGNNAFTQVLRTGRPARIDNYAELSGESAALLRSGRVRSVVGVPLIVEGQLWGAILAGTRRDEPMPPVAEERMLGFGELVAAAIEASRARAKLQVLLGQQQALRHVATLVATEAPPGDVFAAVAQEVVRLFDANVGYLCSFEPDDILLVRAAWSRTGNHAEPGVRVPSHGDGAIAQVRRTGSPARVESYEGLSGPLVDIARAREAAAGVASPVAVEGRLWGVLWVASREGQFPPETEELLTSFAELVSAAIANSDARTQLAASRARVVAASDETRRRIERNLHDGTQQRLVTLALELRAAREGASPELDAQLARVEDGIREVLEEVREIARGLHPAILSEGGLTPALKSLARRAALPVDLDLDVDGRLPEPVEVAAYYVVSEALTNAAKHADATGASVGVERRNGTLRVSIRDDGVGGADPGRGSGLVGLSDRVEALGGHLEVASQSGSGTAIVVEIPVPATG